MANEVVHQTKRQEAAADLVQRLEQFRSIGRMHELEQIKARFPEIIEDAGRYRSLYMGHHPWSAHDLGNPELERIASKYYPQGRPGYLDSEGILHTAKLFQIAYINLSSNKGF